MCEAPPLGGLMILSRATIRYESLHEGDIHDTCAFGLKMKRRGNRRDEKYLHRRSYVALELWADGLPVICQESYSIHAILCLAQSLCWHKCMYAILA
jgi:hypothetical protein